LAHILLLNTESFAVKGFYVFVYKQYF